MARKPNYRFERLERERKKAAKKAERLSARQEKAAERKKAEQDPVEPAKSEDPPR
ncbi:MAG: hypothetical protein QNJ94_18090 [Alphaproteobacteria bacterium]|nr:hypothetical protein [Alphaproteobacteria bacterium]